MSDSVNHFIDVVLVLEVQQILFSHIKANWSRYVAIFIKFSPFEDQFMPLVDDVANPVNQVTSLVHNAPIFVKQLAVVSSEDDVITGVVNFKLAHNILELEVRSLSSFADFGDDSFVSLVSSTQSARH